MLQGGNDQNPQDISENNSSVLGIGYIDEKFYYMAPEKLNPSHKNLTFGLDNSQDIWSLGCITLEMLTGKAPWLGLTTSLRDLKKILGTGQIPKFPRDLT